MDDCQPVNSCDRQVWNMWLYRGYNVSKPICVVRNEEKTRANHGDKPEIFDMGLGFYKWYKISLLKAVMEMTSPAAHTFPRGHSGLGELQHCLHCATASLYSFVTNWSVWLLEERFGRFVWTPKHVSGSMTALRCSDERPSPNNFRAFIKVFSEVSWL